MKHFLIIQTASETTQILDRNMDELIASLKDLSEPLSRDIIFSEPSEDPDVALDKIFQSSGNLVL